MLRRYWSVRTSAGNLLYLLPLIITMLFLGNRVMEAQGVSSSLVGTVVDTTGGVVPGANVTLTNLDTGTALKTATDGTGRYAFPTITVGTYRLTVSKKGFKTYELSEFKISVAQDASENVVLSVGQLAQTVTVNGGRLANLLQTNSNDLGTLIERQSVAELPLNGRNLLQLAVLSAAATPTESGKASVAGQTGRSSDVINVAGAENDFTMYLVDGIQIRGSRAGNLPLELSLGAIDQFKVHYGFFMPSMGPDPGVVDLLTKSGSNRFHGEAYEFVRNNAWEARNFFSPEPPGPFHRNQFGGDVGGPISKDKLFFFANYEGLRQDQSAFQGAFAPTEAMFNGDFSALSTPIYNPASFDAATGERQAFLGNIIPPTSINPVSQNLLKYYIPGSSYSERPHNVVGNPLTTLDYDQFTGRIDSNLSERNRIFGEFNYENSSHEVANLMPMQGHQFPFEAEVAMVGLTSSLTASTVNELRVGWARDIVWRMADSVNGLATKLGLTGLADTNGVSHMVFSGIGSLGSANGPLGDADNSYQIHDSLSWLHGNHLIKFGEDLNYMRSVQMSANGNARGVFRFNNLYTSQLGKNTQGQLVPLKNTGNSFADFLLGFPTNAFTTAEPRMHYRWTTFSPYIQDSWKIRPRLTLNFGLGYFLNTPPNPVGPDKNYIHSFDFATGHVIYSALGQVNPEVYPLSTKDFAPRVGLAWQPGFSKNTVIRAGWGIYYALNDLFQQLNAVVAPGVSLAQSIANAEPQPTYVLGQNALPPISLHPITQAFANSVTGALDYLPSSPNNPYVEQWTLDVQHSLGRRNLLDVAYLGNEGHHLQGGWDAIDYADPSTLQANPALNPYPAFPYILTVGPVGNSNYQALLGKFQHQFSNGLSLLADYTFSKTMVNGSQGGFGTLNQMGTCRRCDSGPALFSSPQTLSVSTVWDLPFGHGGKWLPNANKLVNTVAGGWSLDVIGTFDHGAPFYVSAPNTTTWANRAVRANRFCNGRGGLSNSNLRTNGMVWIDNACFAAPPSGYLGNSGMGILTGPGINNWDIGLHKTFQIREGTRLEFRGEFFNAFNHAQFATPDAGVTDVNFGKVTATQHAAREVQLGLRLVF